jgi:hypothetical protein
MRRCRISMINELLHQKLSGNRVKIRPCIPVLAHVVGHERTYRSHPLAVGTIVCNAVVAGALELNRRSRDESV